MKLGPLVWESWPQGRRCYLRIPEGKLRIHHGPVGLLLALIGVALLAHDWRDRPWSPRLSDEELAELRQ